MVVLFVIPADPGSKPVLDLIQDPGQAPESSLFKALQKTWTLFFNGAALFYEAVKDTTLKINLTITL